MKTDLKHQILVITLCKDGCHGKVMSRNHTINISKCSLINLRESEKGWLLSHECFKKYKISAGSLFRTDYCNRYILDINYSNCNVKLLNRSISESDCQLLKIVIKMVNAFLTVLLNTVFESCAWIFFSKQFKCDIKCTLCGLKSWAKVALFMLCHLQHMVTVCCAWAFFSKQFKPNIKCTLRRLRCWGIFALFMLCDSEWMVTVTCAWLFFSKKFKPDIKWALCRAKCEKKSPCLRCVTPN